MPLRRGVDDGLPVAHAFQRLPDLGRARVLGQVPDRARLERADDGPVVGIGGQHDHLTAHAVLAMLVIGTLGGLALAAAATALTALVSNAQSAQPVLMLTYLPLVLLSGAFGALRSLPHWVMTVVSYLPAQPVANAISQALLHNGGPLLPAHDLAVLAGWLIGGLVLSVRFFRWNPGRPRHARAS
jgi:ABC-type Na+ efflux pump permease subunit